MQTTTQAFNNLNQNIQPQARTLPAYQTQNLLNPSFCTTIQQGSYVNQQQQQFNQTGLSSVGPIAGQIVHSGSQANLINNQGGRVLPQSTVSNLNLISGAQSNIQAGTISHAGTTVPKPTSTSRMEYIPIQRKVVDYETRQVISNMWVPVQRKCLNYYAIQHITEYIPRQVDDVRYEMVPQEYVQYKLQYVPVERQIVHMPHDQNAIHGHIQPVVGQEANLTGITQEVYNNQYVGGLGTIQTGTINAGTVNTGLINAGNVNTINTINPTIINTNGTSALNIPGYQSMPNTRPLPKSNYVTSDGYVPSYSTNNYASNLIGGASSLVSPSTITNLKANQQAAYQRNFTQSNSNLRPISIQSRPRETLDDQWGGRYVY